MESENKERKGIDGKLSESSLFSSTHSSCTEADSRTGSLKDHGVVSKQAGALKVRDNMEGLVDFFPTSMSSFEQSDFKNAIPKKTL
jgi:hypothetical protein